MSDKDDIEKLVQEKLNKKFEEKAAAFKNDSPPPPNPGIFGIINNYLSERYEKWLKEQQNRERESREYGEKINPIYQLYVQLKKIAAGNEMLPPEFWDYQSKWERKKVDSWLKSDFLYYGNEYVWQERNIEKLILAGGSLFVGTAAAIPVTAKADLYLFKKGNVQDFLVFHMAGKSPSGDQIFHMQLQTRKQDWTIYQIKDDGTEEVRLETSLGLDRYQLPTNKFTHSGVIQYYKEWIAEQIAQKKIEKGWTPPGQ